MIKPKRRNSRDIIQTANSPLAPAKLANTIYQIKVYMNKLRDDNGQLAGLRGRKKVIATEDAQLNQILDSIWAADDFSCSIACSDCAATPL